MAPFPLLENLSHALSNTHAFLGRDTPIALTDALRECTNRLVATRTNGRKVLLIGNGGSAAIASHHATDFMRNGGLRAMAFNDPALITCLANDFGYEEVFSRCIERHGDRGDVLIAISSSGKSPNILQGALEAHKLGLYTLTLSGFDGDNPLSRLGHVNFHVPSHSYGVVETIHLGLIHGLIDEVRAREDVSERTRPQVSSATDAPHPQS